MPAQLSRILPCGAGGLPWPHVAIVLLLVLGTRSHSVLCIIALVLACILATLHTRGLR